MAMEAAVEFLWWVVVVVVVDGSVKSHFHVRPKYNLKVVLCCRWGCNKM